jgi:hypothetical protein
VLGQFGFLVMQLLIGNYCKKFDCKMTWGCQAGVETANLITDMKNYKITNTESNESIKLGIDAHAKWYYVARQLDGATPGEDR